MKYLLTLLLPVCFFSGIWAQKTKPQHVKKTCLAATCCDDVKEKQEETNLANKDFALQASTVAFSNLHEAPLDFELTDELGTMISFDCPDGKKGMAYAVKATAATNNYLIVIQEWWGLNDYIKQEAENYHDALGGKVNVLAIDLYDGKIATTPDSARSYVMTAMGSNRKENIIRGAIGHAGNNANIYTVGWCFGGMMSLQAGIMAGKQGVATVMYYGQPENDMEKLKSLKAEVMGIFGTQDKSIPNETVDQFAARMKELGKHFELLRYNAPHAFANPSNPSYNPAFRQEAFIKSAAFLKERLK